MQGQVAQARVPRRCTEEILRDMFEYEKYEIHTF